MHLGATVLGQKTNQARGFGPIHRVIDETPGPLCGAQSGTGQGVEMMGQRRARHLERALDLLDAFALKTSAHQQAENPQAIFLSQGGELFDASLHYDISSIIEL